MSLALTLAALCLTPVVVDGDGLICAGEEIRIANIDAPDFERSRRCAAKNRAKRSKNPPWCSDALADRARHELRRLVATGRVTVERQWCSPRWRLSYGRTCAVVRVNGRDVGPVMVGLGLARVWRK